MGISVDVKTSAHIERENFKPARPEALALVRAERLDRFDHAPAQRLSELATTGPLTANLALSKRINNVALSSVVGTVKGAMLGAGLTGLHAQRAYEHLVSHGFSKGMAQATTYAAAAVALPFSISVGAFTGSILGNNRTGALTERIHASIEKHHLIY